MYRVYSLSKPNLPTLLALILWKAEKGKIKRSLAIKGEIDFIFLLIRYIYVIFYEEKVLLYLEKIEVKCDMAFQDLS